MTPLPQGVEPWMPNGFPPPSFVVDTERTRTRTFVGARGRWLAAAAILGALLLIAGILLIARDDDKTDVATGSTTTVFGGTNPTFPDSSVLDPTATLPDANTVPGAVVDPNATIVPDGGAPGSTAPGAPAPAGPAPGAGVLSASPGSLSLGKVDATVGPGSGKVTLRNTGASPLTFTASSELPGALTLSPATGTIGPGGAADVTVTLDAAKVGEGGFSRNVGFSANGAIQRVTINATTGTPPSLVETVGMACGTPSPTCSKVIRPSSGLPTANPCNSPWRYALGVDDESTLASVKAIATVKVGAATTPSDAILRGPGNVESGPEGLWQSGEIPQLPAGAVLTFRIEAVDQFQFVGRTTNPSERTITCP